MLLLVGSGPMAVEYAKVLKALHRDFLVVGRGAASAEAFTQKTGVPVITGGLDAALQQPSLRGAQTAIVSVGVEALFDTSVRLLKHGVKQLLIEKPGVLYPEQAAQLQRAAAEAGAQVFIAYNRRFLSSVRQLKALVAEDGGLRSFTFDFTEWGHEIAPLQKAPGVKAMWLLGNSSHVLDLAFHIGGQPAELHAQRAGGLEWHPDGAIFTGSGVTESQALFSYHADWDAPGRWGLEFCTARHKFILRPMEKLQVMKKGSVQITEVPVDPEDARLDAEFKPGLYRQVEAFFKAEAGTLCSLEELVRNMRHFCAIAGYAGSDAARA